MSSAALAERRAKLTEALAAARSKQSAAADRTYAEVSDLLAALGERSAAIAELHAAAALPPGRAEDYEALGFSAFNLGAHELSRDFYARVVDMAPGDALAWYNLATSDRNVGRLDSAELACNRALSLNPALAQAALLRSHLRTQTPSANHIDDLRRRLTHVGDEPGGQIFLNYALGKELDDLGDYEAAFEHFARGARLRRQALSYDVGQDILKLTRIREAFDARRLAAAPTADPVVAYGFIIGLPRSGTTMVERVLTGHPDVLSNGETDNLLLALTEGAGEEGDVFDRVANADPKVVAEAYRQRADPGAPYRVVLEKLPLNYLYAGAIRLSLPQARTILVTRNPGDNGFAMFSTLFGAGYPFSYDLAELAAYYLAYAELMAHWRAVLGPSLLELRYEDFVTRPAEIGPAVAAHLGVEWREEMTRIENNRAASATASAAQIRRPIYTSAVGRWRNYAPQLRPLTEALANGGVDVNAFG